jgi:DNA polymerase-3 subunit gamma/tau
MPTLYRDYRPSNFAQVFGQNHIKITLQNEIASNKHVQAYLFCGPRAVGKTTLARVLAKSLNCENRKDGDSEPCNECASCRSINSGTYLDVVEIDAASNTGVDNVRENVIASARVAPGKAKFRVFIIDEVHMLSLSAWNALLKILEEPPKQVVFILCTTEIHKVPLTIISRCERYDFKRISISDIVAKLQNIVSLEKVDVDTEVLEAIARQSDGHLRDAESLLGQVLSLGKGKITWNEAELIIPRHHHNEIIDLLEAISKKDAGRAIRLVNNIADGGLNLKNFIGEGIVVLRKILLNKANPGLAESLGLDLGDSLELRISALANDLKIEQIVSYLEALLSVYNNSGSAFIAQLPLEMKIVQLCTDSVKPLTQTPVSTISGGGNISANTTKIETKNQAKIVTPITDDNVLPANDFSPEEVNAKWPEFLARLREQNHSLSVILQNCKVGSISGAKLALVFKYKFHKDRINDLNIKAIVEKALRDVFGGAVLIDCQVDENIDLDVLGSTIESKAPSSAVAENNNNKSASDESGGNLLNNLLQTFGGEVVS